MFVGCANKRNQKPRPSKYVTDKHGRLVRDQSLRSCGIVTAGRRQRGTTTCGCAQINRSRAAQQIHVNSLCVCVALTAISSGGGECSAFRGSAVMNGPGITGHQQLGGRRSTAHPLWHCATLAGFLVRSHCPPPCPPTAPVGKWRTGQQVGRLNCPRCWIWVQSRHSGQWTGLLPDHPPRPPRGSLQDLQAFQGQILRCTCDCSCRGCRRLLFRLH